MANILDIYSRKTVWVLTLLIIFFSIIIVAIIWEKRVIASKEETIPVFIATDENYAPFASIMMKSLLTYTDADVDFYIMGDNIEDETKKLIKEDLKKYPNKKLIYLDMTDINQKVPQKIDRFPAASFYNFFIPYMVPNLTKVIQLEPDMIIKKDIRKLYNQDLGEYPLGAVIDTYRFSEPTINLHKYYPAYQGEYLNTAVLLMDVSKLLQRDYLDEALKLLPELDGKTKWAAQDAWNILFENNYKKLNPKFNFMGKIKVDPVIIHYADGKLKPWKGMAKHGQRDFDAFLEQSVFCERIKKQYHRLDKEPKCLISEEKSI